jgi:hypothetical protein
MPDNTTCFVIAPIGEPDSPVRKRSDQVLKYVIRPAAEACTLTALRADQISKPGLITTQVIQHILEDPIVVADLTGHNANVFYELAIRHAIRRPYIQIIDEKDQLPFDVAGVRSIQFSHTDLDSVSFAREQIAKQIAAMLASNDPCESPITVAVDLSTLSKSTNPEDRRFGDVLTAIAELTRQVASLQQQIITSPQKSTLLRLFEQPLTDEQLDQLTKPLSERPEAKAGKLLEAARRKHDPR